MKNIFSIAIALLLATQVAYAQTEALSKDVNESIETFLTEMVRKKTHVPRIKIDSATITKKEVKLFASVPLSYMMFSKRDVDAIYQGVSERLPQEYKKRKLVIYSDKYLIEDYVPERKERFTNKVNLPLLKNLSKAHQVKKGLQDKHLAIWQSHGWYYEQKLARWEWQRARIFQTVEDLYTQGYVLPYLVPMLENAGANVLLPRERDTQRHEVIVDRDKSSQGSLYTEKNGKEKWIEASGKGFAHLKEYYVDGENPFKAGTYQEIKSINKGDESLSQWIPNIPEKGSYAVYVSYHTVKNSAEDARYTVHHLGGKTEFAINQTMGGGTWIYLGTFVFDKGLDHKYFVELSNKTSKAGRIVTADAVKIGGGMGNIARLPHQEGLMTINTKSSESIENKEVNKKPLIEYRPEISAYPRYTEGARYWLQWAGAPDSIYNKSESKNDYTDDFQSRGFWVNYIAGGSSVMPKEDGLHIPVDLAMAFHSDAGTTFNDSIIGTLGICMTHINDEKFVNKMPRLLSRDLTHYIMDEIEKDIRTQYEPQWTTRHIWNRSYAEARVPEVPTMLLELLSHQNFADMRYGMDPRFLFTVSRSVYKGMLKFIAKQNKQDYVVQPLPVNSFALGFTNSTEVQLRWKATADASETNANPTAYMIYTKIDDGAFDNGQLIKKTEARLSIEKDRIYSYKITAVNDGGESFPSETLSVSRKTNEKGIALIVNGFDRLSAPYSFASTDSIAGFVDAIDHGVPYINQYNYIGSQKEFRRKIPWMDDDASGFGDSYGNYETMVIAGNTFDYPAMHGKAMAQNDYSFVSSSRDAVTAGVVNMNDYKFVDLILGKQKQTKIGRGVFGYEFKTFPKELQNKITAYCDNGGHIFVSGAFVASDLWDTEFPDKADQEFANKTLGYKWRVDRAAKEGKVKAVASPFFSSGVNYEFYNQLNTEMYVVESPDALEPAGDNSHTVLRYSENNLSAGIASSNKHKTMVVGFPFESIKGEDNRKEFMKNVLEFMYGE